MKIPLLSPSDMLDILFLSESPTAIYTGEQVIIQLANAAMLKLWGKDSSIIGKPMGEAIPELKDQGFIEILQSVWRSGESYTAADVPARLIIEGWYKTSYFDFSYKAIKDNDGKMCSILHTATDVTSRFSASSALTEKEQALQDSNRRLQDSNEELAVVNEELWATNEELLQVQRRQTTLNDTLQANEQRLQQVLDTMAEGVGIVDANGQLVYANAMAQRIFNLSEAVITERTFHDTRWCNLRMDGTALPEEEHPMYISMASRKPVYDHEIGVQLPGKEIFYLSINAAPLLDAQGNLTGGVGTFMDVTARRKNLQSKDDFISIASHELKTPLTSLKASLQMLDKMKDEPALPIIPRLIEQSNRSMDKMIDLVEELLDSSKMMQGQLQLHKSAFTMADVLYECCNHIRQAGRHNLVFQGDDSLQVVADRQRIDQVVVNFVNNAVKYAPDSIDIFLTVEQCGDMARVSVKDTGPGIPADKLPFLFNRYYQATGSSQRASLGLGLYICSEIIKKHGGQIGADSEVGKGSTFWIMLPLCARQVQN